MSERETADERPAQEPPREPLSADKREMLRTFADDYVLHAVSSLYPLARVQIRALIHQALSEYERQAAEVDRLRVELADALPFLRELAGAHLSLVDEDDVIIKVRPGRAAWLLNRARVLLAAPAQAPGEPAEPPSGGPA